jgi:hypothetical protein
MDSQPSTSEKNQCFVSDEFPTSMGEKSQNGLDSSNSAHETTPEGRGPPITEACVVKEEEDGSNRVQRIPYAVLSLMTENFADDLHLGAGVYACVVRRQPSRQWPQNAEQ